MDRRSFLKSGVMFGGLLAVSGLSFVSAEANVNSAIAENNELPFQKAVKTDQSGNASQRQINIKSREREPLKPLIAAH